MTTLANFKATKDWQEITGVSDVSGEFVIGNKDGINKCFLYLGDTPTGEEDAFPLNPEDERPIDNTTGTEKVWAKTDSERADAEATIIINQT
jgi:hypothetical protein